MPDSRIENAISKRIKWQNKKNFIESRGVLTVMRECEWNYFLTHESERPKTKIYNILEKDNEESLLKAIRSGDAFGFIGEFNYIIVIFEPYIYKSVMLKLHNTLLMKI